MSREIEGKYFGTEISQKWWKRYRKDKMFARGNGVFSYNQQSISFIRQLTEVPIVIKFDDIQEFRTGNWHAGQWAAGQQIFKVIWTKEDQILSSGFTVLKNTAEISKLIAELNGILEVSKQCNHITNH
jgi:membrane protease subunit (stomatin/prohibitin family)